MHIAEHRMIDNQKNVLGKAYWFMCPGCEMAHKYEVRSDGKQPSWKFNGDMEKPTFTPSLLNTNPDFRCHLFIKEGRIQFCGDCWHDLSGKTVDLPELPDWLNNEK